jgi:CubicO group peptidase (beta-lactamase class C family)
MSHTAAETVIALERARRRRGVPAVDGFVKPGFEPVGDAFLANFRRRGELGAACAVTHCGERVVDLWGGVRDPRTGARWERDTMALVHSTTKGMAGLAMALAHSRGLLDYDAPVCASWPEFAQHGKERITVRQLLSHQAGLFALDEQPDRALVEDLDRLAAVLARQRPAWSPGTWQAYHAITMGFYESELLRRVDPAGRTIGRFFRDEIAVPLGLEFHIGLPREVPDERLAPLRHSSLAGALLALPLPLAVAAVNPGSRLRRALRGSELAEEGDRVYARELEIPAGGGVGTARALARAYGVFATGGRELRLATATLRELSAPPVPPAHGFRDAVLKQELPLSLGFMRPGRRVPFAHPTGFGAPGAGGSCGFADPHFQLGFGYVTNRMGASLVDAREETLRIAAYRSIGIADPYRGDPYA